MNDKVVYLFGAGASFNAIPVVSGMGMRLRTFLKYFMYNKGPQALRAWHEPAVLDLKWYDLVDEVNESYSIDTLARRAWLSDDMIKLSDIKQLIGAYILWEQLVKPDKNNKADYVKKITSTTTQYREATNRFSYSWDGSIVDVDRLMDSEVKLKNYDYRYESLISVIAEGRYKLSDRFGFISWNYDNQVEIAVDKVFGLRNMWKPNDDGSEEIVNRKMDDMLRGRFYKLNGSASLSNFDFEPPSRFYTECRQVELGRIRGLLSSSQQFSNRIHFAWENKPEFDPNRVFHLLEEAKYIVIIGYSFPEFNREMDKKLIDKAALGHNKKFIIQDTIENIDRIESRLKSIKSGISVTKVTDLNQFYIPL